MNKFRNIFMFVLFTLFVSKVYALSYDINTIGEFSVDKGSKIEINVSVDNIKDTTDGISVCSMNILFDKDIVLESSIRTLDSWTMTRGNVYLFDTGNPVISKSNMFTIPVVVNGKGTIKLNNILCSDGVKEVEVSNKIINFDIKEKDNTGSQNNHTKPNDNQEQIVSNCNLSNIELSEGEIEFDPNITEYEIEITNFEGLEITPKLEDSNSSYIIDRNYTENGGNVVITVNGTDGKSKVYTIYTTVLENNDINEQPKKNSNFIPIFIGIIVLLILVNIFRIIKSNKKK